MTAIKKLDIKTQNAQHAILESIKNKNVANPIIQRLRQNIVGKTGLLITSYDRMHHRHSRS